MNTHKEVFQALQKEGLENVYKRLLAYTSMKMYKLTWLHDHEGATKG